MPRTSLIEDAEERTNINLSSMIDCIFILLIFFIVTTVFVEESGIQVGKPDVAAIAKQKESENIVFEITAYNKILFEGREIDLSGVVARVQQHLTSDDIPIIINSHEKSDHGLFVSLWDEVQLAGGKKIAFTTLD